MPKPDPEKDRVGPVNKCDLSNLCACCLDIDHDRSSNLLIDRSYNNNISEYSGRRRRTCRVTEASMRSNSREIPSNCRNLRNLSSYLSVVILLALLCVSNAGRLSRQFEHNLRPVLRPKPASDLDMPIMDLIEPPDGKYNPPLAKLNLTYLREKLGRNYEPRYMSYKDPRKTETYQSKFELSYKKNKRGRLLPIGSIPNKIRRVNFRSMTLPDGTRVKTKVSKKQNRKLRRLLWQYTYCPVVYTWRDLGVRFWPRWIREGRCSKRGSCSVPPGMTCKAKRSSAKTLLRWHCQDWDSANFCRWIPVKYPIITECTCAC